MILCDLMFLEQRAFGWWVVIETKNGRWDLTSGSSELCYAQGILKPYVAHRGGMQFCLASDLLFFLPVKLPV